MVQSQANLKVGGDKYWCQNLGLGGPPWPVYQQVAVALYILGAGPGSTAERARIKLNIGYGTVFLYVSRTVNLLASMATSRKSESALCSLPETPGALES